MCVERVRFNDNVALSSFLARDHEAEVDTCRIALADYDVVVDF